MGKDLVLVIIGYRDSEFTILDRFETLGTKKKKRMEFGARLGKAKLNLSKGIRDCIPEVERVTEILVMT